VSLLSYWYKEIEIAPQVQTYCKYRKIAGIRAKKSGPQQPLFETQIKKI